MNICLYGASSNRLEKVYLDAAYSCGKLIGEGGHTMIFGGGAQGVMGAAARGVHENGGRVVGVAPSFFNVDGILYDQCDEFIYTETMRQRKQIMDDRSEAFILAPGGFGSFEEFFEILTLKQLAKHNRPIAILNTQDYYKPMEEMIEHCICEKFAKQACRDLYRICNTPQETMDYILHYHAEEKDIKHLKNI